MVPLATFALAAIVGLVASAAHMIGVLGPAAESAIWTAGFVLWGVGTIVVGPALLAFGHSREVASRSRSLGMAVATAPTDALEASYLSRWQSLPRGRAIRADALTALLPTGPILAACVVATIRTLPGRPMPDRILLVAAGALIGWIIVEAGLAIARRRRHIERMADAVRAGASRPIGDDDRPPTGTPRSRCPIACSLSGNRRGGRFPMGYSNKGFLERLSRQRLARQALATMEKLIADAGETVIP